MNFLITGGAGFIGSHLIETLLAQQHHVTVIDNLSTGKRQNLHISDRLTLVEKDFLACTSERRSLGSVGQIDGMVHLAAIPSVNHSWLAPLEAHNSNISATVAAIQLCQQLSIPRIVFASSAAVYGNPTEIPLSEASPTQPISPYGLQKRASEQYLALFSDRLGISSINLRLFNVFGPRQSPASPYSGVISIFTQAMKTGQLLTLYGDGSQTRDFIYVQDVAAAFARALVVPMAKGDSQVCNIGTGKAVSLHQLVNTLKDCLPDWPENIRFEPSRQGDIQHSQANVAAAASLLDFSAQWSLRDGLQALVAASA